MRLPGLLLPVCLAGTASAQFVSFNDVAPTLGIDERFARDDGYPTEHGRMLGPATVGDFNVDGLPDLFVPTGGAAPDRLFINQGGTFADEAASWGIATTHRAGGCAVGDFNRDGFPDLFVVSYGDKPGAPNVLQSKLYRNNGPDELGQFSFTDVAVEAGVNQVTTLLDGLGAAFGDYNLDGHLDLFVASWLGVPGGNRLFKNLGPDAHGEFRFIDATDELGIDPASMRAFTPRFADVNDDGLPDLVLTNDFNTSRLLLGTGLEGAPFYDATIEAGIDVDCNGMGSVVADLNADGRLDWFIQNIYYRNPDRCGNTLYVNEGANELGVVTFTDQAASAGVIDGGWGWGTSGGDFDNDGDTDLACTSGWPFFANVPARIFLNDGAMGFADAAPGSGFDFQGQGRGLYHLDYDDDGDLDIVIIENGGPLRLYRNNLPRINRNRLRVRLVTHKHPCLAPMGYGTRLELSSGGATQVRYVDGAQTYLGQSEMVVHFGLGSAEVAETLSIRWADGSTTTLSDLGANQTIEIVASHPADWDNDGVIDTYDLLAFLGAFEDGSPDADLDASGTVDIDDAFKMVDLIRNACG